MTKQRAGGYSLIMLAIIALMATFVASVEPTKKLAIGDAAAVVLVATTAAVAIERAIEFFWSVAGFLGGTTWPLNLVGKQLDQITSNLNSGLIPYQEQAAKVMARLNTIEQWGDDRIKEAQADLDKLKTFSAEFEKTARDKEQLHVMASAAAETVNYLQAKYTLFLDALQPGRGFSLAQTIDTDAELAGAGAAAAARLTEEARIVAGETSEEKERRITEAAEQAAYEAAINVRVPGYTTAATAMVLQEARFAKRLTHPKATEAQLAEAGEDAIRAFNADLQRVRELATQGASGTTAVLRGNEAVLQSLRERMAENPAVKIGTGANLAKQAISGVTDFVASFKDNPGKRLISLGLASIIGLALAGLLRLDIFTAILSDTSAATIQPTIPSSPWFSLVGFSVDYPSFRYPGVALTGLLLGLGSAPTHEVVRVLQEYKKARKGENAPETTETDALTVDPAELASTISRSNVSGVRYLTAVEKGATRHRLIDDHLVSGSNSVMVGPPPGSHALVKFIKVR